MKTTKQKIAEAIARKRAERHYEGYPLGGNMPDAILADDDDRADAQAALEVVTDILIKESYEMLKHAETLPCSSMKLEQIDFAKGVKMVANKLRGM